MHRFFFILLLCFSVSLPAQPLLEQIFDAGGIEQGQAGMQDASGHLWFTGSTDNHFGNKLDLILVEMDSLGNILLSKQFGGIDHDAGFDLNRDSSGAILACGYTMSQGSGNRDVWLLKCNAQGDTIWQSVWGGSNAETAYRIFSKSATQYMVAGETRTFGNGNYDLLLLSTDSSGTVQWYKTFGSNQSEHFADAIETADGGILLGASGSGFTYGGSDWFVVRTDANGDSLWSRHFGTTGNDYLNSLTEDVSGNYYLLGTEDVLPDSAQMTLKKLNNSGQLIWSKHLPAGLGARGLDMTLGPDGDLWITGYKNDSLRGSQMMMAEADTNGQLLQIQLFGNTGSESGNNIRALGKGHYLLTGISSGFAHESHDVYVVLTDSVGSIPCPSNPSWDAVDTTLCPGSFFTAKNTSISSQEYHWLINDSTISSNGDLTEVFDSSGLFRLSMLICSDTLKVWIQVPDSPNIAFSWTLQGDSTFFHAQQIEGIKSLIWDFGDGSTGFGANPVHVYAAGKYYVRLDVVDTSGCNGSSAKWLTIGPDGILPMKGNLIMIFPVPARPGHRIDLKGLAGPVTLSLFDMRGRLIQKFTLQNHHFNIPSGLDSGTYILLLQTESSRYSLLLPVTP